MAHKTFIPKRFFSKCRISKKTSEWINSEPVEVDESIEYACGSRDTSNFG